MRIALHIVDRTLYTWSKEYWSELIGDLVKEGHDIFIFSDEKHVNIAIEHEKVRKCLEYNEDEIDKVISQCDLFIGVPLRFSDIAKKHNLKIINLLGSTTKGEGVVSTAACVGCIDKTGNEIDCVFHDELCMWLITPTDVKRKIDSL